MVESGEGGGLFFIVDRSFRFFLFCRKGGSFIFHHYYYYYYYYYVLPLYILISFINHEWNDLLVKRMPELNRRDGDPTR